MGNSIGLFGLGVMGQSLARNIRSKGFSISVYNRNKEVLHSFTKEYTDIQGYETLETFVSSLEKPRKIILMVTAAAVDPVIESLVPLLDDEDILIDCGNTFYEETQQRQEALKKQGIHFIGCGVSGGEKGALEGPSIMPSGDENAYAQIQKIFESIAAVNDDGSTCCTYIGKGGSGHFVKMVHNGIEYADMQIIAEAYAILKAGCTSQTELEEAWKILKDGKLNSYLMDITYDILRHKEEGEYLLPLVSDVARQKGTGKWTSQISFDYGIAIPSLSEAVQVRFLSMQKQLREKLSMGSVNVNPYDGDLIHDLEDAMYLARISIYAQGLHLIDTVSKQCDYQIDMKEVARIWQNGCIIKSQFLKEIIHAYESDKELTHLMASDVFKGSVQDCEQAMRNILVYALQNRFYVPVFTSALEYVDGMRTKKLCTNMIQAQRDCFGAHTFEREDKEGSFHTQWQD